MTIKAVTVFIRINAAAPIRGRRLIEYIQYGTLVEPYTKTNFQRETLITWTKTTTNIDQNLELGWSNLSIHVKDTKSLSISHEKAVHQNGGI